MSITQQPVIRRYHIPEHMDGIVAEFSGLGAKELVKSEPRSEGSFFSWTSELSAVSLTESVFRNFSSDTMQVEVWHNRRKDLHTLSELGAIATSIASDETIRMEFTEPEEIARGPFITWRISENVPYAFYRVAVGIDDSELSLTRALFEVTATPRLKSYPGLLDLLLKYQKEL